MLYIKQTLAKLKILYLRRKYDLPKTVELAGHIVIENSKKLKFCGYVYIGPNAFWSAHGGIEIGNNVVFVM